MDDLKQRVLFFPSHNEAVVDTEDGEVEAGGNGQHLVGDTTVEEHQPDAVVSTEFVFQMWVSGNKEI